MGDVSRKPFITVTRGLRGWFAVQMYWEREYGGFWDVWQSGIGSYETPEGAAQEGRQWAEAEGIEFSDATPSLSQPTP